MSNLPTPGDWNPKAQNQARRTRPPWYRSTRFWVPVVLLAIVAAIVIATIVSNSSGDSEPTEILPTSTPNATTEPNNPTPEGTGATSGGAGDGTPGGPLSPTPEGTGTP